MNEPGEQQPTAPPPPPPPEEPAAPRGNPWERRDSLGFGSALIEAIKLFVTSPKEAFAQTKLKGDYLGPLLFAIIVGWIGALASQVWSLLFGASMMSMMPSELQRSMGGHLMGSGFGLLLTVFLAPILMTVAVFVWTAIVHLCLVIVGGLETSQAGFEGSFRVVSYSSVAQLSNLVPLVGGVIGFFWTLVLAVVGIEKIHGTPQNKAIIAVLIPMILCCVCVAFGIFVAGAGLFSLFATQ
ncbi:MAG: YIP1 family protein [Acidobacteriota bacterium]